MRYQVIQLREDDKNVTLSAMLADSTLGNAQPLRPAMIVCPGGGYRFLAGREGEPIAKAFFNGGFQCFILHYTVTMPEGKPLHPRPIQDVSRAICHVRAHAAEYHVDPQRIFVSGFSAGGHLAASIGTLWHEDYAKATPDMAYGDNRPTGVVLGYPVISAGEYAHRGSFDHLVGPENQMSMSLECRVDERTVPTYIMHTAADNAVPVMNALLYASALAEHGIPFELRIFPRGAHGIARADEDTTAPGGTVITESAQWLDEAVDWCKRM